MTDENNETKPSPAPARFAFLSSVNRVFQCIRVSRAPQRASEA